MKRLSAVYSLSEKELKGLSDAIDRELDKQTSKQVSFKYSIGLFNFNVVVHRFNLGAFDFIFLDDDGTDIFIKEMEYLCHQIASDSKSTLKRKLFRV